MRVIEMVQYFQDFYPDFRLDRAYDMLNRLQIPPNERLKNLSKGTKEKVQLILVMSRDADLYVLDEPIAGVDPASRDYILHTIVQNYNRNATILLSTHLISDVENILDEVIFIKYGNIILQAGAEQIRQNEHKSIDRFFREVFAC
jgi:ABC-2 type transport system ATP-binding protein